MTWSPDPDRFVADLEAMPSTLRSVAAGVQATWRPMVDGKPVQRVVFTAMGSSLFAAGVAARRLRARGIDAVADYASVSAGHTGSDGTLARGDATLVVAISAGGATAETIETAARHRDAGSRVVALTNTPDSPITRDLVAVDLAAGSEDGGVACRSFVHTIASLLGLEAPSSAPTRRRSRPWCVARPTLSTISSGAATAGSTARSSWSRRPAPPRSSSGRQSVCRRPSKVR